MADEKLPQASTALSDIKRINALMHDFEQRRREAMELVEHVPDPLRPVITTVLRGPCVAGCPACREWGKFESERRFLNRQQKEALFSLAASDLQRTNKAGIRGAEAGKMASSLEVVEKALRRMLVDDPDLGKNPARWRKKLRAELGNRCPPESTLTRYLAILRKVLTP